MPEPEPPAGVAETGAAGALGAAGVVGVVGVAVGSVGVGDAELGLVGASQALGMSATGRIQVALNTTP